MVGEQFSLPTLCSGKICFLSRDLGKLNKHIADITFICIKNIEKRKINMGNTEIELNLAVGDSLQLQYYPCKPDDEERFYVRVIGYFGDQSIITTPPTAQGQSLFANEEQLFAVRLLSGKSVQAFVSNIIKKAVTPYPYIHLNYPKALESKIVRQTQRASTNIIATVQNEETGKSDAKTKSAHITDMSIGGALVVTTNEIGDVGDSITMLAKIKVADIEDYITISAVIRRIIPKNEDDDSFKYGVEFQSLDDREKLSIHGYIFEQIAKAHER